MAKKKTYYPSKTFDDDLDALAKLYETKKWSFTNVDHKKLKKDAVDQRDERAKHDALESQYTHAHENFGLAQEARYNDFKAALDAARGAFRNDKAVTKELDRFKRSLRRKTTTKSEVKNDK